MAADTGLENLKTDCIAALRKGDEDAFEAAAASLQEFQPQDLAFKMETLGWLACLALKQNCCRSGFKALNLLAVCQLDIEQGDAAAEGVFLQSLRHVAVMAARTHDKELFAAAVSRLAVLYAKTGCAEENAAAFMQLLTALLFMASDRRYKDVLPMLIWLSLRLCRSKAVTDELLLPFLREWACLAAQSARRGWEDIAGLLLNGLFYFLLKQGSFAATRSVLLYVMLHMQMYAAWDGVEKAFKVYAPVQNFSLLVLQRAVKEKDAAAATAYVRLILRAWRDFIAAAARQNMQDEMELYQNWFSFGMEGKSPKYCQRLRRFIQLTLGYWAGQQPKTSKKQLKYLKNIFEPDLVKGRYLELLQAAR